MKSTKQIFLFLILTFIGSWVIQYLMIRSEGGRSLLSVFIMMWVPGLVGLTLSWFYGYGFKDIGFQRPSFYSLKLAYLVPMIAILMLLALIVSSGIAAFAYTPPNFVNTNLTHIDSFLIVAMLATVGVAGVFLAALGEEIGWRGFLHSQVIASKLPAPHLIIGVIWSLWHWPMILFSDYASSDIPLLSAGVFTIMATSFSLFLGWLRHRSESVFPVALSHAVHNVWILTIYPAFVVEGGLGQYFGGESGVFLALIYLCFAVVVAWRIPNQVRRSI